MTSKLHHARWRRVIAVTSVLAILFTACGDDDAGTALETAAPSDGGDSVAATPTTAAAASAEADRDALGDGAVQPVLQPIDLNRDIIYTAELEIAVTDVAAAGAEATRIISGFGGLLFGQETQGLPNPRSVLVFKVLPEDFQDALAALGSIGEVRTQSISADDVTERVVDLESRILTGEASVERLRAFLEGATTVEAVAELEAQLVDRETELERLKGQLRTLQDAVALATITVTLTEAFANPSIRLLTSAYREDDGGISCPGSGEITIEEGTTATLCFEIRNDGDTVLTDFTLVDTVLELEIGDLTIVDGDPTGDLQPGQSMLLSTTVEVTRRIRTQTTVTGVPVNADGSPIETRVVSDRGSVVLRSDRPEGMPGFDDGLRVATDVLQWIWGVIVIGAGLAVPFLWVIPLVALLWWWRRRRREEQIEELAIPDTAENLVAEAEIEDATEQAADTPAPEEEEPPAED